MTPFRSVWIPAATGVALALMLLFAAGAEAGTYQVRACDEAAINRAFVPTATSMVAANASCSAGGQRGMQVRNSVGSGRAGSFSWGALEARAPAGSVITGLRAKATASGELEASTIQGWRAGIADDLGYRFCGMLRACALSSPPTVPISLERLSTSRLRLIVVCVASSGCSRRAIHARTTLRDVVIDVRDEHKPTISAAAGLLAEGGQWVSGSLPAGLEASDGAGIRSASLSVDGSVQNSTANDCDRYSMAPCPNSGLKASVDTRMLKDGSHAVVARVVDGAGNVAEQRSTVSVDNAAPTVAAPQPLQESVWSPNPVARMAVDARDGEGGSGVRTLRWELCRVGGDECESGASGAQAAVAATLPAPGLWRMRVTAGDAIRDGQPSEWSKAVGYDPEVPGRAELSSRSRWSSGREPVVVRFSPGAANGAGPSGIDGYAVTVDGSIPGNQISLKGEHPLMDLADLPEGTTTVSARAISGAGVAAGEFGRLEIGIDRTAPSLTLGVADGEAPRREEWFGHPLTLVATGVDQEALSGMGAAPDDEPVTAGGYVEYRIDDGPEQRVRGPLASIELAEDGIHSVSARAVDRAGNVSSQRSVSYRIDLHKPTGSLIHPLPSDPRRISASVEEGCIASASMELRRLGERAWESVAARASQGEVSALAPDDRLPAGEYELRMRVSDCAGNEGLITEFSDGGAGLVTLPLRFQPTLTAGLRDSRGDTRRRLTARLGAAVTVEGRLTDLHGLPMAGTSVELRQRVAGGEWATLESETTDSRGHVTIRAAGGPSRSLRLVAAQSLASTGAASASLQVDVPARVTIRATRHSLRNGRSAHFSGHLYGGFIPHKGRELELQGYNPLRRRWQPVLTEGLRCNSRGDWRASYRFTATVGRSVSYRFRIRVAPRPDHPFAEGHSRSIAVRVFG